jgi:hypothetical protein
MMRDSVAERLSLPVAILSGQRPCFAEQPLRLGEFPGTERGLGQCLVGCLA